MFFALLSRLWSMVVGVVMIVLSLFLQLLLFMVLALGIAQILPSLDLRISVLALFVLFNGVSCYEYFRKRRVVTLDGGTVHNLAGLVHPNSNHGSMAMFLVPRGLDRIFTGREFTG